MPKYTQFFLGGASLNESEDVFKIQEAPPLVRADDEPDGKLKGEEDDDKVVEKLDDENHPREFNISRLIL